MHRSIVLLVFAVVALTITESRTWAKTLQEVAAGADLQKMVKIYKGGKPNAKGEGPIPNLAKLDAPPARVALISFYVADVGKSKGTYYASVRTFNWLTQDGASHFATAYHEQGIQALKETFRKHGVEILTPDQFLDSDAKRTAFVEYKLQLSVVAKIALGFMGGLTKAAASGLDLTQSAVAPGYRLLASHVVATDPKSGVSLEGLRQSLDVDALLIVKNGTRSDAKNVSLTDVHVMLYGPNPVPKIEGKKYIQYKVGQLYVSAQLTLKKPAAVASFKKKKISDENYDGYELFLAATAERAMGYLLEKINKE